MMWIRQYEYVSDDLKDMFAAADIIVSRAGANAVAELLALKKPNILIPLSASASRGDQILNAEAFRKNGYSYVLQEEEVTDESLLKAIKEVDASKERYIAAMNGAKESDATKIIVNMMHELVEK